LSAPVLLGRFLSPYVRRVAVTLNHFGMAFERSIISAVGDEQARERANPVGRVPALILASGETLIDSAAILDYLDELAGSDRAIIPPKGEARRAALRQIALATGAIDRAMAANAERRRPELQHDPLRQERLLRQARQGFDALERDLDGLARPISRLRSGSPSSIISFRKPSKQPPSRHSQRLPNAARPCLPSRVCRSIDSQRSVSNKGRFTTQDILTR